MEIGCLANNADPNKTPHNAASDQGLRCLFTECYVTQLDKNEKYTSPKPKLICPIDKSEKF